MNLLDPVGELGGLLLGLALTLFVFSYVYKDNPLYRVAVHDRGNVHGGPLGGGRLVGDPPDVLADQLFRGRQLDLGSGQSTAIHLHHGLDAVELDAGREGLQHLLGVRGLDLEVGQPALGILIQQLQPLLEPPVHLVDGDPLHGHRARLDELGHGAWRDRQQRLRQAQDPAVGLLVDLRQRL